MTCDDIESLLKEIEVIHTQICKYHDSINRKRVMLLIVGIYTLYLFKIFHKTKGLARSIMHVRGTDLLLITYASSFLRLWNL